MTKNALNIAYRLRQLAQMYETRKKWERALSLYQETLHIQLQAFGPNHAEIGETLSAIAGLLEQTGQFEQAATYYKRALRIFLSGYDYQDPRVSAILNQLNQLYRKMLPQHTGPAPVYSLHTERREVSLCV